SPTKNQAFSGVSDSDVTACFSIVHNSLRHIRAALCFGASKRPIANGGNCRPPHLAEDNDAGPPRWRTQRHASTWHSAVLGVPSRNGIRQGEPMSRRRFWLSLCVAILAVLALLAGYAGYRLQRALDEQHVELDWQDISLTWRGLLLHEASLVQRHQGELHVQAGQLQLQWLASEAPHYRLTAQSVRMDWRPEDTEAQSPADSD